MAGLSLRTGLNVRASTPSASYANTGTVDYAAFSPGTTSSPDSQGKASLRPGQPVGNAFWAGVLCVVGLVVIRWSLPN